MRAFVLVLLQLQMSLLLLWWARPGSEDRLYHLIPGDIVALIVLNDFPPNLDFFRQSRVREWLEVEGDQIMERLGQPLWSHLHQLFQQDLERAVILIHHLQRTPRASYRIHFSALLVAREGHQGLLEARIAEVALRLFGSDRAQSSEGDVIRIYWGAEPGQILYQVRLPNCILISNSDGGWRQILRALTGETPSLRQNRAFQKVQAHLREEGDFFLYVRTSELLPFLPQFGYTLGWSPALREKLYVLPRPSPQSLR